MAHLDRSALIYLIGIALVVVLLALVAFFLLMERGGGDDAASLPALGTIDTGGYTDLGGNPVALQDFRGKVLIVNSWASWCPFCVRELPDFASVSAEFGNDVAIIAINRAEQRDTITAFLEYVGNPTGIVFLQDAGDTFYAKIGGFSMPETQVYDREGNLIAHRRGALGVEDMRQLVRSAFTTP